MPSKRTNKRKSKIVDEEDEVLGQEAGIPKKKKLSRILESKEKLERYPVPEKPLHKLAGYMHSMPYPWFPDVVEAIKEKEEISVNLEVLKEVKRSTKALVFHVTIDEVSHYLKIFASYEAGYAEAMIVPKLEELQAGASFGKLAPRAHGPCVSDIGPNKAWVENDVTYFALYRDAGVTVGEISHETDIAWPLDRLCADIQSTLKVFRDTDPTGTGDVKFSHGDAAESNYLIDLEKKTISLIDFGNSYLRTRALPKSLYLSPRNSPPGNGTYDVKNFCNVIKLLLRRRNTAVPSNDKTYKFLRNFFSCRYLFSPSGVYQDFISGLQKLNTQ